MHPITLGVADGIKEALDFFGVLIDYIATIFESIIFMVKLFVTSATSLFTGAGFSIKVIQLMPEFLIVSATVFIGIVIVNYIIGRGGS